MDYCGMYFDLLQIERRIRASSQLADLSERAAFMRSLKQFRDHCWEAMAWEQ